MKNWRSKMAPGLTVAGFSALLIIGVLLHDRSGHSFDKPSLILLLTALALMAITLLVRAFLLRTGLRRSPAVFLMHEAAVLALQAGQALIVLGLNVPSLPRALALSLTSIFLESGIAAWLTSREAGKDAALRKVLRIIGVLLASFALVFALIQICTGR